MIRYLVALALAAAAPPAFAQDMWSHQRSGISMPRSIGDLRLNREQDASGGGQYDVILQYGDDDTAVTVYVYRSAYPNPALWFERTRMAMSTNVGAPGEGVDPQSLTLGGASAPNGLREDIAIPAGGRFRATSVAIAQAGEWIVKARISSARLDRAGVGALMDRLLGAMRFASMPPPHPLIVPAPCAQAPAMNGTAIDNAREEALAAATVTGMIVLVHARGGAGLAAQPSQWCRESSQIPPQYAAVYRARDGGGWVALIGDSGRAVAAMPIEGGEGRAASYVSVPAFTSVASLYDALPEPDAATQAALPIVAGRARGLIEIGAGPAPDEKN